MASPIKNSKNAASGHFKAGGNIRIGDDIHYHNDRKIPRLLTGLPFVPEGFQGRDEELHYIYEHLFGDNNLLLLVNGEGGVGKTSLASRYFYTHQDKYAHLAWVFSEKNLGSALLQMAIPLGLQFDERADTLARLQVLLQSLFELQKPCLLIIDNANDLAELHQYLPLLQRCSNFHLLFTTRVSDFPQVAFYKIEPLPQDLALQVFKSHYPAFEQREEEALFYDLYEAVQGNTLVLELLAKNLRNFNNKLKKHYLLADLRRDLEQGLLKLSKTSTLDVRYQAKGQGLRSEKMELIILAMYDMGDLSATESQLLAVFAVLPAESIPFERLEILLPEQEGLDTTLLALAQKGWLEYNGEAADFKCSPVVQEVVLLKQKELLLEHCRTMISSLCEQLDEEHRHVDNYVHSTLFVRYGETLLATLAILDDDLGTLCQNIGIFYTETGDLIKALALYQHMEWIQAGLSEENPDDHDLKNGLAISYSKLGETHRDLGNLNQALTFFEQYNTLKQELYASYPQNVSFKNGLAISYEKLGETHRDLGNLNQALTFFETETKLFEELYVAYPQNVSFKNGLAISYSKLGQTHRALGNLNQALTFFEQYNNLEKELYAAYPQNVSFKNGLAISYQWLGITHRSLNNLEQALHSFQQFRALEEELFKVYPLNVSFKNNLAYAHKFLGLFFRDQKNDPIQARIYLQPCHDLWQELAEAFPAYVEFSKNYNWVKGALEGL